MNLHHHCLQGLLPSSNMATLLPDARAAYTGWVSSAQHNSRPDDSSPPHTIAGSTSTPIAGTTLLISLVVIGGVMLIAACAALITAIVQRRRSVQPPVPMPEAPTTGTMILRTNTGDYGSSYASNGSWYTPFWQQNHSSSSSGPQQGVLPAAGVPVDEGVPVVGIPVVEPGMVGQVQDAHVAAARQASLNSWAVERRLREWAWLQREQQHQ